MARKVLIIDDEASIRQTLSAALSEEGFGVSVASGGAEGIELVRAERPEIVLLDIWMPGMDGLETLKRIRAEHPDQLVVLMSGHGTIETAVKGTKLGAYDFVEKPLSLERILVLLQNAGAAQDLARENHALRKQVQKHRSLIGESPAMRAIRDLIQRVAPTTGSVLITGENGTGKELVAQSVHALSPRYNKPFVEMNCAAIPEELIESELFGHEKGSFTGATAMRRGKFDLANGGTLFLDEIADMSLKTQAKILRILQEQKFERLGGNQSMTVDVRIVAATNKDLRAEIGRGTFREDLFYRLNVVPIQVPPLRDRREDVALLADHFLQEFCHSHGRKLRPLKPDARDALQGYRWPGNVRELKNLIERMIILTPESMDGEALRAADIFAQFEADSARPRSPDEPTGSLNLALAATPAVASGSAQPTARNLRDARAEFEKEFIQKSLEANDWNVSKTAQTLGVERSHLHRKIKAFGIAAPGDREVD